MSAPRAGRRWLPLAFLIAPIALAALTSVPGDSGPGGNRAAYPDTFPAGPGKAIAERACLICHSPMLVTQQSKDSTGWEKTLTTMKNWGTPLERADRDTLRTYLLTHFGPKPSPARQP